MSEWPELTLGELSVNHDAKRRPVKEANRLPGPYPYYGASGIVDWVHDYLIDGEYLLVAEDGENLRTRQTPIAFLARGKSWVNNHAHIITGNERADTRFLAYALEQADVGAYLTGAVMPKLTQANLNRIPLRCPPVEEQRGIVSVLAALDDKIELNRRTSETLETMARALFQSWFVDFDPVRAKAEGESEESISERLHLPPELLTLFPDAFESSVLGEVPMGWRATGLDRLADLRTATVSPAAQPRDVFEHFSIPAYDAGRAAVYELGEAIKSNKYRVSPTAVLVSKLNPETPRIWLPDVKTSRAVCSTEFMQFEPQHVRDRSFLYLLLQSAYVQAEIQQRVTGSTGSRQRAQPSQIAVLPVVIPPRALLQLSHEVFTPFLDYIASRASETLSLAASRDALLPELLSGRVRLPSAE